MLCVGHSQKTSSLPSRTGRPLDSAHTTFTQKPTGWMRSQHTRRRRTVSPPPATASAFGRTVSRICADGATGTLKVPLSARSPGAQYQNKEESLEALLAIGAGWAAPPSQSSISSDVWFFCVLVTFWTTAPHPGALGFKTQCGPDSGWLYGLASNPLRDLCAT